MVQCDSVMWVTVLVFLICVVLLNAYSCPSPLNPCRTPNGTEGHCTRLKHCPPLNLIVNRTDKYINTFVTQSICGYDVDKSKLYCCDVSELDVTASQTIPCPLQSEELPSSSISPQTVTSQLNLPNKVVNTFESVINEGLTSSSCQTPNGDLAQCISIFQCPRLLAAAMNSNDWNSKRFLRESKCGYEDRTLFVCCGSAVNFKNAEEARRSNFQANPLVPTEACGIKVASDSRQEPNLNISITNRIFGGINSEINEFSWVVLLQYENIATGRRLFLCGGSLISSRYVLTAAHCVTPNPTDVIVAVRLGAWNKTNLERSCTETSTGRTCVNPAIDVGVEKVIPHPQYTPRTKERYNDIALIRLRNDVKFEANSQIYPICLPNLNDHTESGTRLTISGWGLKNYNEEAEIKQKVDVPVIPVSQCSRTFLNNFVTKGSHHILGQGQFCAGGESGKDACVGDSGAPAMIKLNSTQSGPRWYLTGIVSFGIGCGFTDRYGVYTKVSEYVNWIHQNIVV